MDQEVLHKRTFYVIKATALVFGVGRSLSGWQTGKTQDFTLVCVFVCVCVCVACLAAWSHRKAVLLWPQLWAPTPPIWESWTWATITQETLELRCSLLDWRIHAGDWTLSGMERTAHHLGTKSPTRIHAARWSGLKRQLSLMLCRTWWESRWWRWMFQHAALTLFPPQCGARWSVEAETSSKEV